MSRQSLPRPEAVIFDIGNVLLTWDLEARYDSFVGPGRRRAFFAAVDLKTMHDRIDLGADIPSVIDELALRHPEFEAEIRLWQARWLEIIGPVIARSVRLLRALRAVGVPVFALSNFGGATFALAEAAFPFLAEFDRRYISAELGLIKPDPAIYAAVEADCGIAPERLLFADDLPANIAAAEARGWQGHLFTSPEGWADRLVSAGLLSQEAAA